MILPPLLTALWQQWKLHQATSTIDAAVAVRLRHWHVVPYKQIEAEARRAFREKNRE